jgi:pilus assembly protein CpaE
MTVIVELDHAAAEALHTAVGNAATIVPGLEQLRRHLENHPGEYVVILGPSVDISAAVALADTLRVTKPTLGVILVRRRVDTAVLAEALRAGMREVVEERDLTGLNDAVSRVYALHTKLTAQDGVSESGAPTGKLFTVFSAKGGVGKTTVSTNLAAAIADGGKRSVCIVDLDLAFGDVSIVLQLFPVHTIADAVALQSKLDPDALESLLTEHSPGLHALVAPVQPDSKDSIHSDLVGRILRMLKERFDVVVVDTPPAFDEVVLQAFDDSDLVLLVGTLDVPALKSLKITAETLSLLNHPKDRWRLVLNRADVKVGLTAAEFEKTLGMKISASIPQSRDVPASINHGKAIVIDSPRHPVSQVIKRLAAECLEQTQVDNADAERPAAGGHAGRRTGLLRRKVTS